MFRMECDSSGCEAVGKVCDALGIQFVTDIEIDECKDTLETRVNSNQKIKKQQREYADEYSFEETGMTKNSKFDE